MHRWRWTIVGAVVLTAAAGSVYWVSVPTEFNVVRGNRSFFDSDGEFITRQFRQGRTFTHNDHLLYHLAARAFHDGAAERLPARRDAVRVHKLLSVGAGALGLGLLFVIGYQWLGHWLALLPALRGGPHPLDRFSSQLRWNPVHDSSDLGLTGTTGHSPGLPSAPSSVYASAGVRSLSAEWGRRRS